MLATFIFSVVLSTPEMYVLALVIISLQISVSYCETDKPLTMDDPRMNGLLHFGTIYGQHIISGLNYLGRVVLPKQIANFDEKSYKGKFSLYNGLLGLDLDIHQVQKGFRAVKMSPLPTGAEDGIDVYYRFLVKKITVLYDYNINVTDHGDSNGNIKITLKNQTFDAKVSAIRETAGKCVFSDYGLSTKFDPNKYNAVYCPVEGGSLKDNVTVDATKILNTFVVRPLLKLIHERMNNKLIAIGEAPEEFSGIDFKKEMEKALCCFV